MFIFNLTSLEDYMQDSAGVSTIDPVSCAAIPFMAFADAIEEYEADSGTDDEGDIMNA